MAVIVIPIAVSVHTVVSWVFGMTIQPMWHSTIFGPYFVAGAIFSGIAALIVTMAVLRWAYRPRRLSQAGPFQQPWDAAAGDDAALVLLHVLRIPYHLLWRRAVAHGRV